MSPKVRSNADLSFWVGHFPEPTLRQSDVLCAIVNELARIENVVVVMPDTVGIEVLIFHWIPQPENPQRTLVSSIKAFCQQLFEKVFG